MHLFAFVAGQPTSTDEDRHVMAIDFEKNKSVPVNSY